MGNPFVDNFSVQTGSTSAVANSITPATAQEVALLGFISDHDDAPVPNPPDASWTQISLSLNWWWKQVTSTAPIATAQSIAQPNPPQLQHVWTSLLALLGSNGLPPVFSVMSVGTITNPGPGNTRNLQSVTFAGGETGLFLLAVHQPATGFGTTPDDFIPSDSLGLGSWTVITEAGAGGGTGNFAQIFLAIATGVAAGTTQLRVRQSLSDANSAGSNSISGGVGKVTNLAAIAGLRLLLSMGVGI